MSDFFYFMYKATKHFILGVISGDPFAIILSILIFAMFVLTIWINVIVWRKI